METKVNAGERLTTEDNENVSFRDAIRKQLNEEVKKIIDLEMRKATQELIEEQRRATKQIVEEYRAAIRQAVDEEKKEIWKKAEALKQSMLQLGL